MNNVPHFLIIGAQKSGTTSLYHYLEQHPQISLPHEKEIHFFDLHYAKGAKWYLDQFEKESETKRMITGEASPYYIYHPLVPERVKEHNANIKLILLLRNPVERAISHYNHALRWGLDEVAFDKAIDLESTRLLGEEDRMVNDPNYFSYSHQHHSYTSRGFYSKQIRHWLKYFPREQLLILNAGDLFTDSQNIFNKVTDFLHVEQYYLKEIQVHNKGINKGLGKVDLKPLRDLFKDPNEELFTLIGEDFGWNDLVSLPG